MNPLTIKKKIVSIVYPITISWLYTVMTLFMYNIFIINKDKVHRTKMFCKRNYKVLVIMKFQLFRVLFFKFSWLMFY